MRLPISQHLAASCSSLANATQRREVRAAGRQGLSSVPTCSHRLSLAAVRVPVGDSFDGGQEPDFGPTPLRADAKL